VSLMDGLANFVLLSDTRCFAIGNDAVREIARGDITDARAKGGLLSGKLTVVGAQFTETWKIYPRERAWELAAWFRTNLV